MTFRPAHHAHRVGQSRIELQRRIAGDVAVLAARMLEHLLHGGKGGDRSSALRVRRGVFRGRARRACRDCEQHGERNTGA
jgi:hypothetical protein